MFDASHNAWPCDGRSPVRGLRRGARTPLTADKPGRCQQ